MGSGVWTEVEIEVALEAAELVAVAIGDVTGGVEIRDSGTLIKAGQGRATIVALVAPERLGELLAEIDAVCARARAGELPVDPVAVRHREAHEDEWRDVWKKYFRATRVGETFIVRPSWDLESMPVGPSDRIIDLDPGRAFGTGGHASTRLAIALAESSAASATPPRVSRFLDLGCGSGILAIAAALLWPEAEGLAIDNDPEATACARENLDLNHVARVQVVTGTLDDAGEPHDVILANIQADVLLGLAPTVPRHLRAGGILILSGLLTDDAPSVVAGYRALGFQLLGSRDAEEWTALLLVLASPPPPTG
jgi:ribosomal protein L11 methyltransferase